MRACVLVVVLLVGVAAPDVPVSPMAGGSSSCSGQQCGCTAVSSLLLALGFSHTCVASSLALCSSLEAETELPALVEEVRGTMREVKDAMKEAKAWRTRPRHCQDLLTAGDSGRGVRRVYPLPDRPSQAATVYCDHTVDGGGWTVFQRRTNATQPREDFYRSWVEYQLGFGRVEGEMWLGLDLLHALTSLSLHQLRVDLVDYEGHHRWAKYGLFHVGPSADHYRLSVGRYSGDAGDSLAGHNGQQFSTHDADHDTSPSNCASTYRGGWWYEACHSSNLNGYQHVANHTAYAEGVNWRTFKGYHYSLMNTTMMVKPAF